MRVVVIGASGTIGRAVVEALGHHDVIAVSRRTSPAVDLGDQQSVLRLFQLVPDVDAVISCAANAPLADFTTQDDADFRATVDTKLFGQIGLVREAARHLRDNGSITVTSGAIPHGLAGASGGALTNAGLDAFVTAVAPELPRGLRVNAVSPGWVRESLEAAGMDPSPGTPAQDVAKAYVQAVDGTTTGATIHP